MSIMELPEDFDPRLEDYKNPVAKTYSSGLGAKIQNSANGVSEGVMIHVSNVPKNMSEVELENLFSQCGNPKIRNVRRNSHKRYMDVFVQYNKMSEVQSAIKRFNGQEPYNLKLAVVENESQNRQELPVFNEPMALATQDQIARSTDNFPAPNLPAFYDKYKPRGLATQTQSGEFSLGRMFEQSISLSDNRRVHGGRVYWTRPKNTYKVRKTSDKHDDYLTAFLTGLKFARSKMVNQSGEEPMIPDNFSKGECAVCGVLSNSYCNRCREVFYCCPDCQASHWAKHKLVCGNRDGGTTPERKNGLAATESANFERNVNNMSSRENSKHIDESKHETQGLRRPADANMYMRPSPKKTSPPNYNQNRQQSDTKLNVSETSSGSKKAVADDHDRKSDSSERSSYSKKIDNACKTRPKTTPVSAPTKPPTQQSFSYSKKEVTATTSVESKVQVKKRVEAGMVKNVCVASADSLTEFWVHLEDDMSALNDLGNELNKRINDSSPGLKSAAVDEWCCKQFDGNWTRARIVTAAPLQIIYVDYGNMEPATLDQLKVLPADLAAQLPPFAINVLLACGVSSADAQNAFPVRFLSELERGQWTVEKAQANEVSELEEAKPLEVDSVSQSQSSLIASLQACAISPTSSSASTTSLPYFKEGEIYEVIVQDVLDTTEFYVTKSDKKEDLVKMQLDLNCEISDSYQQLENIEVNSKCAAKYAGEWYRASVQKLDPLTVFFIDFGNEEICKPADLKQLPPRFRKGLYTVRIRLPGPASKEQLEVMNFGPFKLRVAKKEGKYWLADFATVEQSKCNPEVAREKKTSKDAGSITRQDPKSRPEPNPDLSLLANEKDSRLDSYKKITDVTKEKDKAYCEATRVLSHRLFTCILAPDSAHDVVMQIYPSMDLGSPSDKTYRPEINEMVAVYRENIVSSSPVWSRGIVLSEINGSYSVALVDYGLLVVSSNIKKLPDAYKKIPLLSVKLSLKSSSPIRVQTGEVFHITLLKKLADVNEWEIDVYSTSINDPFHLGVGRLSSWTIEPDQVPELATQKLESGNTVIISSFHDINTVYVQPITTQLKDLYECLSQEVAAECIKADYLDRDPFVGELVAAKWDQDGNHYRAQILGKANDKGCYKVLFVDYGNIDNIHTSKMKSISNKLKSVPCCAIKVGLASVVARTLTPAAHEYGIRIAEKMDLLKIEFEVFEEVQLTKLADNTNVNKTICELLEPSWMREQHTNTSLALQNYPMLQDLPEPNREDRFQIGKTEKVLLAYVPPFEVIRNGRIQLIVCKATDKRKLDFYTKDLCEQMKDYIASQQKGEQANRYVPHKGELCICLGQGDTPMRAECIKILDGNTARLVYIDYGIRVEVSFNRIFKMPKDLMQLSAYATYCYADGFPANTTHEKISSVQSELDICEAEIKSFDNEHYTIHIPELIARLS